MPVLPDVASRIVRSRVSAPDASPSRIIRAAARSFTDPPGFCHSAFAYSSTPGVARSTRRKRTRSDRLGPLVATGPFAVMRNPLYAGNVLLWAGFALGAHAVWMAIVVFVALGLEYHAIVRWEEQLLETRMGDEYKEYVARVPRWIPTRMRPVERRAASSAVHADSTRVFSWRETFYRERGTAIGIAAGYLLLWAKSRL